MGTKLGLRVVLGLLACLPTLASAQVFKCEQSSGLVTYSDKPCHIVRGGSVLEKADASVKAPAAKEPAKEPAKAPVKESKETEPNRIVAARSEPEPSRNDGPTAESLQLRALGPNQALDRQGKVYDRVANGYLDANGLFYPGVANGHRPPAQQ